MPALKKTKENNMAGITIYDAFKALDDISDDVVKDEVKKVSQKQPKKLKESVETINISGNDMYDKGQAYYYARTGDHVDYDGKRYEIIMDKDGKHKIGYSDTILLKGDDGETIEVSKKDFIDGATLLKEEVPGVVKVTNIVEVVESVTVEENN